MDYPNLETYRLLLRRLALADAAAIQRLFPQWGVVQYLAGVVPWPYPSDGALTYLQESALAGVEAGNEWHWTLRLKSEPEEVIGMIGLFRGRETNRGFWIGTEWQGQGLMTEAVEVVTEYWFGVLGFPVLRVAKAVANVASRRISERGGMRVVEAGTKRYVSGI